MPRLARGLSERGHRVTVLTFGEARPVELPGVRLVAVRRSALPLRYAAFLLRCLGLARDADLLFVCEHPRFASMLAARLRRKPVVLRVMVDTAWEIAYRFGLTRDDPESFDHRRHGPLVRLLQRSERRALAASAHVVAVARHLGEGVVGWGIDPERVTICYNLPERALDDDEDELERRRRTARRRLGLPADRFQLLVVCRLIAWKRVEDVVSAMASLPDDCHLAVVGEGPEREKIETSMERLGLGNRIELTGAVDRDTVSLHMLASDLLLLPSLYEGLSHVLVEAMQAGLPVAVSDIPGNRELVREGETGRLFPVGDIAALRRIVLELRTTPEERAALAKRARTRLEQLAGEHGIERLVALVESVARSSRR